MDAFTRDFDEALDLIKNLCDILDNGATDAETVGNAIMNAMNFYSQHRPTSDNPDDLPF